MNWTDVEFDLMRQIYPKEGARGCLAVMPNRTHWAIQQQAKRLGLARPQMRELEYLFAPNVQPEPLSALDRIAMREWGHITRKGQLVPMIRAEIAEAA